jgi:hypothetical protein
VTCFVYRSIETLFFRHREFLALYSHHNAVSSILKVADFCMIFALMNSLRHCRINQIFDFRTSKSRSHSGQLHRLNVRIVSHFSQIKIENVSTAIYVGQRHVNLLVEPTWSY